MRLGFALASAAWLVASSASATVIHFTASLDCAQEVPSTCGVTSATGSADITLDTDTNLLTWSVTWTGLSGAASGMHFHGPAAVGQNAGIIVNIGGISGLTSPSAGSTTVSAAVASTIQSELSYINIHSALRPNGEIRGQVVAVPAPQLLGMLALAGAILATRRSARAR